VVIACVAYPCSFVSCEQRRVKHPLSNLCLCQRRSTMTVDDADCVIDVISPRQQQQPVTCSDCSRPPIVCRCDSDDRRQRRSAACRARCGRHERRSVKSANGRCRNGGTPSAINAAGSSALCQCRAGFFGDRCQLLDPCREQPCRNGGYCRSLIDLTGTPPVRYDTIQFNAIKTFAARSLLLERQRLPELFNLTLLVLEDVK